MATTTLPAVPVMGRTKPDIEAVRISLVGLNFGRGIACDLARSRPPGLRLASVCDRDAQLADTVASDLGVRGVHSLDAVLEDSSIEAVALFTGPQGRADLVRRIIRSGRHVITTKPFEVDVAAARSVLEEAGRLGRIVHLNSPTPVQPEDVRALLRMAAVHDLGRPLALRAETWAGYREKQNGSWYDDPQRCPAAPLLRLGIYFLNDFCPLLGEPESVHVQATRLRTGRPTPDHAQCSIRFRNGSLGQIFASFCIDDERPYQDEVRLVYERGVIHRRMERPVPHSHPDAYAVVECTPAGLGAETHRVVLPKGDYAGQYRWGAFARAVRGEPEPQPAALADPIYGVRLLSAIAESCRTGAEAPVPA